LKEVMKDLEIKDPRYAKREAKRLENEHHADPQWPGISPYMSCSCMLLLMTAIRTREPCPCNEALAWSVISGEAGVRMQF